MFPQTTTCMKSNSDEVKEGESRHTITKPTATQSRSFKTRGCAVAAVLISVVLVAGVCGSIILYGIYAKPEKEITYRTFEDDGVKHWMEVATNDADRVETVVFQKIENVTDGGTIRFDFNQKLAVAYSDKDNACYIWADDSLDWEDRDWLFNGDPPSYNIRKEDEIQAGFLKRVIVNKKLIINKCFDVKTYWATMLTSNRPMANPLTSNSVGHRMRKSGSVGCKISAISFSCSITIKFR